MLARRRANVAELNRLARGRMAAAGLLGEELDLLGRRYAVGHHVVVRRDDATRGIANGDRAMTEAVDQSRGRVDLAMADGRRVQLDLRFLVTGARGGGPSLEHGYAMIVHVAQGATVDRAYVLADGMAAGVPPRLSLRRNRARTRGNRRKSRRKVRADGGGVQASI